MELKGKGKKKEEEEEEGKKEGGGQRKKEGGRGRKREEEGAERGRVSLVCRTEGTGNLLPGSASSVSDQSRRNLFCSQF